MTDFKTQEDLDIFLLNGGRVQFTSWSRQSPTFMFMDLDRKVYYGNDNEGDYRFAKPVALDYRTVRVFIPVVKQQEAKKLMTESQGSFIRGMILGIGLSVVGSLITVVWLGWFNHV